MGVGVAAVGFREDGLRRVVTDGGEEELLPLVQFQQAAPLLAVPVAQLGRAFGDDDQLRLLQAGGKVPQPAPGKEFVLENGAVIVNEDDVYVGGEGAVLEGIVQDDEPGPSFAQHLAAAHAVFVHGDGHGGELPGYLQGLVAAEACAALPVHRLEAAALALVPARQDGQVAVGPGVALEQFSQNQLGVRGFPGTSGGNVANTDGGDIGLVHFLPAFVVCQVPDGQDESVNHCFALLNTICKDSEKIFFRACFESLRNNSQLCRRMAVGTPKCVAAFPWRRSG